MMRRMMHWVRQTIVFLFGELNWVPPMWLRKCARGLGRSSRGLVAVVKTRKKTVLVAVVLAAAAATFVLTSGPKTEKEQEKIVLTARIIEPVIKAWNATENPPVIIRFDRSAAKIDQVDKAISSEGLALDPEVKGAWKWQGDRDLVFVPEEDWPIGGEYTLSIDRSFLPEHTVFEQNELTFKTPKFTASFRSFEFASDPLDEKKKTVAATIEFSHPVNKDVLEKRIALKYEKPSGDAEVKPYNFTVEYNKLATEAYVHSGNIPIPADDMRMRVVMDKGVVAKRGGSGTEAILERVVSVPGMYTYFRVDGVETAFAKNMEGDPDQIIVLNTNIDVHESEIRNKLKAWVLPLRNPNQPEAATTEEGEDANAEEVNDAQGDDGDGENEESDDVAGVPKGYDWSASEVDAQILKKSEPVALKHIPQEREYSSLHTLKFKAEVGRKIYIRLEKGTKAWGGYVLAAPYDDAQIVNAYPMELAVMHDGAVLSTAGRRQISVMTRGVPGLHIELARVMKSQVNHLLSQAGGRFDNPRFGYNFGPENIAEIISENRKLDNTDPSKSQYTAVDFRKMVAEHGLKIDKGLFLLDVRSWDEEKYVPTRSDKRLVLITDLGIIAKKDSQGKNYIFVQSIADGSPKADAEVAVIGKNGLPVIKGRTDETGLAALPPLSDFVREKSPTAFVVTSGDDFSYLPVDGYDRRIDYSRFDVGGVTGNAGSDNLDAYLFSERGIYRPGDEMHIGIILKAADWTRSLEGLPIELSVVDPRGQEVLTQKTPINADGFLEMIHQTEEGSPTGNYTVSASLLKMNSRGKITERDLLGSVSVRVEEFLPDSMTIKTALSAPPTEGWVSPNKLSASVSLRNLYGTPAADRRVSGKVSLSTKSLWFKGYADFSFHDPLRAESGYVKVLGDMTTDPDGQAQFDIDLSEFAAATYALTFTAEGFEADGGRSVTARDQVTVSPLKYIVGVRPDGDLAYISRGSRRAVDLIALGNDLSKTAVPGVAAILYERRYISTLVRQYNGIYKYQSVEKKVQLSKSRIELPAEGLNYLLKTDAPGDYVLELEGREKTILSSISYTVGGDANLKRNLDRTGELEVQLDKASYSPGETIEIQIKAPYKGAGLITIERERVYAHKWFKTGETSSVQTITIPADVDVNAYVNIAMVRDLDSPEIFMSPLTNAVTPFSLSRDRRTNSVSLKAPELVIPGEDMAIEVSTPSPTKLVVFAVDEGILQVAGYVAPDPLSHFLSKRALEVTTSQILDMILPEYNALENAASEGGDDEGEQTLGANLNPFKRKREKPAVFWSGIIDAGPDVRTLHYTVPDYFNGTLRVMAVAVSAEKLGIAEQKTVVRGPFVLRSSPPLFAAPGDVFDVSVTVANNVEGSGKNAAVKVALEVTENLKVVGGAAQTLEIGEGKEKTARFQLKAEPKLGNATLHFRASAKNQSAQAAFTMSIRPKNPKMTTVTAGYVRDGAASIPIKRRVYPEYRKLSVSVSPLPLALADGLLGYLDEFPHGCTEQIVSRTVPALVLGGHKAFKYDKKTADHAVLQTIRMLQARQNSDGAFGYWAANSYVSDQQTVYAAHFLTAAAERGFAVPSKMLENAMGYLKQLRENSLDNRSAARLRAYAVYVLALNGELSSASVAALREYLDKDEEASRRPDVTYGYLAATYALMQDKKAARAIIAEVDLLKDTDVDYADYYDDQVYRGTMLYLMAEHFPEALSKIDARVLVKIADAVKGGNYNTLSSAHLIYGLEAYGRRVEAALGNASEGQIAVRQVLSKEDKPLLKMNGDLIMRSDFAANAWSLEIASPSDYPVFYQVTMTGFDLDNAEDAATSNGVEVIREYRNLDQTVATKVKLGDEIEVVLKLRSTRNEGVGHLALVDLLPGGFEAVLGSGDARIGTSQSTWSPEYVDIREDRILLYGDIESSVQMFIYRIKAVNRGTFAVPPSYLTSMYDPSVSARTRSSSISVAEKPQP